MKAKLTDGKTFLAECYVGDRNGIFPPYSRSCLNYQVIGRANINR